MSRIVEYILRVKDAASATLGKAGKAADGFTTAAKSAGLTAANLDKALTGLAMAGPAAAAAFIGFNQQLADSRNELLDWSTRTTVAAETLGGLRLAAKGSGLDFTALAEPLIALNRLTFEASKGNAEAAARFDALGLSAVNAEGGLRSGEEVLQDLVARLGEIEDPAQRAAAANSLLGEQGSRMLQALGNPEALGAFTDMAREFGVKTGPAAAQAAGEWQRATSDLKMAAEGLAETLSSTFGISGSGVIRDFTAGMIFLGEVATGVTTEIIAQFSRLGDVFTAIMSGDLTRIGDAVSAAAMGSAFNLARTGDTLGAIFDDATSRMLQFQRLQEETLGASTAAVSGGGSFTPSAAGSGGSTAAAGEDPLVAAAAEREAALESLRAIADSTTAAMLTGEDKIRAEYEKTIAEIMAVAAAHQDNADVQLAAYEAASKVRMATGAELYKIEKEQHEARLAQIADEAAAMKDAQIAQTSAMLAAPGQAIGAVLDPLSALSMAGPYGAAIGESLKALEQIGAMGTEAIVEQLRATSENIIKGIAMLPELQAAILNELPYAIGQALAETIKDALSFGMGEGGQGFGSYLEKGLNLFTVGAYGLIKGLAGGAPVGEGYAVGDQRFVSKTGMQLLHEGETVVRSNGGMSASSRAAMGAMGGGGMGFGRPVVIQAAAVSPDVLAGLSDVLGEAMNPSGWGRGRRTVFGG